jgi:Lysyl oxidase
MAINSRTRGATSRLLLVMVLTGGLAMLAQPGHAVADKLPDLRMARLRHFQVESLANGTKRLRFSTVIVNVGVGPFETRGQRTDLGTQTMSTDQVIYNDVGLFRTVATSATMVYGGDGHNHWHVKNLQQYVLTSADGSRRRTGAKTGFCFYDNFKHNLSLPGAPQSPVYTGCGTQSSLTVNMGLSVGWGDIYYYNLAGQYVDITGLPLGRYRLTVTADQANWFLETDNTNNFTWVDLELTSSGVTVIQYGPSA